MRYSEKYNFASVSICCFFSIIFLFLFDADLKSRKYVSDLAVKKRYMKDFLKIFGSDILWQSYGTQAVSKKVNYKLDKLIKIGLIRSHILMFIDDVVWGKYKNVRFHISEVCTSLLMKASFMVLLIAISFIVFLFLKFIYFLLIAFCVAVMLFEKSMPTMIGMLLVIVVSALVYYFKPRIEVGLISVAVYCLLFVDSVHNFIVNLSSIFGSVLDFFTSPLCIVLYICLEILSVYKLITVPFRGVVVDINMNKQFKGRTIILERAFSNREVSLNDSSLQEVVLEDVEFMKKYIVYPNDQVEARYLLTTSFIERFNSMKFAFNAKYIRANFSEGKISIIINSGKDLFSMVNMWKKTNQDLFENLFEELYSVVNMIEVLNLNKYLGLYR